MVKIRQTISLEFLLLLLLFCQGCTLDTDNGSFNSDSTYGIFNSTVSKTTVNSDVYVAPNTTLKVSRKRPVYLGKPMSVYYDQKLRCYVGVDYLGHKHLMPNYSYDRVLVGMDEDSFILKGGSTQPGRYREHSQSETRGGNAGIIIKK